MQALAGLASIGPLKWTKNTKKLSFSSFLAREYFYFYII